MTAAHRAKTSEVILLNPFNVLGLGSSGFNPIAALTLNEDFPDDALELAESIIRVEGSDPHWSQAGQELVAGVTMYVRLVMDEGSFADVRALLSRNDAGIQNLVLGGDDTDPDHYREWLKTPPEKRDPNYSPPVLYNKKLYPGMVAAAERYKWPQLEHKVARFGGITPTDREMHSVLSTALTQTRWLDSIPVARDLASKNKIDFSIMKEKPVTVYIMLPARRLGTHSAWLRLTFASIVQKLMKDTRRAKVPICLLCDEFAAMAGGVSPMEKGDGFPIISRNAPLFRGFSIKLWTIFQDLAQAKSIFGDAFESFLANAGVVQVFAPQDVTTAKYLSDRSGQTTRQYLSGTMSINANPGQPKGVSVGRTTTENFIAMPLMLPQDFRNLGPGHSIIFSHVENGPVKSFVPWPGDDRRYRDVMRLDPANA